jgi:hypothetical protein
MRAHTLGQRSRVPSEGLRDPHNDVLRTRKRIGPHGKRAPAAEPVTPTGDEQRRRALLASVRVMYRTQAPRGLVLFILAPMALGCGNSRPVQPEQTSPAPSTAERGPHESQAPLQGQADGEAIDGASKRCLSVDQVLPVVSAHQTYIQRHCWEGSTSTALRVNVSLDLTVGPDGRVEALSARGDDSAVAACIEKEARGWRFPGLGCRQRMNLPFQLVRQ